MNVIYISIPRSTQIYTLSVKQKLANANNGKQNFVRTHKLLLPTFIIIFTKDKQSSEDTSRSNPVNFLNFLLFFLPFSYESRSHQTNKKFKTKISQRPHSSLFRLPSSFIFTVKNSTRTIFTPIHPLLLLRFIILAINPLDINLITAIQHRTISTI